MLSNIVKWALLSLIIIGFIHYFYNYFKTNLTTPKVINLNTNLPIPEPTHSVSGNDVVIKDDDKDVKFTKTEQIIPEQTQATPELVTQTPPQIVSESAVMTNELSAFLNNELKKELKLKPE